MRRSLTLLFAATAFLLSAHAALAAAESFTVIEKDVTESFTDVVPCVGEPADVTITYNFALAVTELDNGTSHLSGALAGTFTAVTDDVTYTGHFAQRFGENVNAMNSEGTVIFVLQGTGTDGSRITFADVFHYTITATGVETSFDKPICQ
jgi:hypothetical protein